MHWRARIVGEARCRIDQRAYPVGVTAPIVSGLNFSLPPVAAFDNGGAIASVHVAARLKKSHEHRESRPRAGVGTLGSPTHRPSVSITLVE